jgi:hypothetical protein
MIDKLCFKTKESKNHELIDSFAKELSTSSFMVNDKNYNTCKVYRKNNKHLLTLKYNPKLKSIADLTIETNPSNYNGLNDFLDFFKPIIDDTYYISRIDLAVDIPIPIIDIFTSIKVKFKRDSSVFKEKGNITGIEIGSGNELFCIYDKAYERIRVRKYKKIEPRAGILTRFEVRLKNQKVPYKSFSDISYYSNFYPFGKLTFYKLKSELPKKLLQAGEFADSFGMNNLVKMLSSGNNFNKTYLKHLEELSLNQTLKSHYLNSISNQLEVLHE